MLNAKGYTLLEVLITVVLLTTGLITVVVLFATSLSASIDAENTEIATNLAQARMEEIRNLDFTTGIVNEAKAVVPGFALFQREVTVTTPLTDLKQVTVTVYWTFKSSEVNTSLVTYISKN